MANTNHEEIDGLAECVLNRMDSKNETLEVAIENVIGDKASSKLGKIIAKILRGEVK